MVIIGFLGVLRLGNGRGLRRILFSWFDVKSLIRTEVLEDGRKISYNYNSIPS